MKKKTSLVISNDAKISALYFALLQSGYNYYKMGRDEEHIREIQRWYNGELCSDFFLKVKQNTCTVYPYWPRAALLETASFYLVHESVCFEMFDSLYESIMSAGNLTEQERNQSLWEWIADFPDALREILSSESFKKYLAWEEEWIAKQNVKYEIELLVIQKCVNICMGRYNSPVQAIRIVINPIKCAYSADYHLDDKCFVFCSGDFNQQAIIHEFLHHIIHPIVVEKKDQILKNSQKNFDLDDSYYISGNDEGRLNAFEEYVVRKLTMDIVEDQYPVNIPVYIESLC